VLPAPPRGAGSYRSGMETTLVLVKPDAVRRGLVAEILGRFERRGLRLRGLELLTLDTTTAERHYAEHRAKPFFADLVSFITSGPLVACALAGEDAVGLVRAMMGATDPKQSPPGTIRGDLAISLTENLVHGSDSAAAAERELSLFFPQGLA
jgi:nucleoside-diphosphate kinase